MKFPSEDLFPAPAPTSLSRPELDSVSLAPAIPLWSDGGVWGESVCVTVTMVPSSDT